jgi:hypothetical protein
MKTAYPENENSVSGGTKFIDTDPRDLSEYLSETNLEITKQRPGKNQTGKNQTASRQNPNPETESLKKTKRPQRYPNSLLGDYFIAVLKGPQHPNNKLHSISVIKITTFAMA